MKLTHRSHRVAVFIATLAAAFAAPRSACAAPPADPRPLILILGDQNSLPTGNGASWPQLLQKSHPQWNIVVNADPKRTLPDLTSAADAILAAQPHVEALLIFTGTPDVAADAYAKADATALAAQVTSLIKKAKAAPTSAKATILLATPMPVIDARLDQWSQKRFNGGEKNSLALAEALRTVAKEQGATLVDFHKWAYDDAADAKPGRLLGTIGFTVRDWGHPIIAKFFSDQFAALKLTPPDAAAFELWQRERAAALELDQLLAKTAQGLVSHGPEMPTKLIPGKDATFELDLPPDQLASQLTGQELNLLFTSAQKPYSPIGSAANRPMVQTNLLLTVDAQQIKIPLKGADWQLIDEAQPETPVDPSRYRFNMQKMNYFGLTSNEPGQRRWMLARFDLSPAAGKKITAAKLVIGATAGMERFTPPDKVEPIGLDKLGPPAVSFITGPDTQWDDAAATWKSRDGKTGWTGGQVDAPARKAALEAFLKTNPPPQAAQRAASAMQGL